jgi:hypothetical protein
VCWEGVSVTVAAVAVDETQSAWTPDEVFAQTQAIGLPVEQLLDEHAPNAPLATTVDELIDIVEVAILAAARDFEDFEVRELTPVHHFSDGVYVRELFIPAGTILTSKHHLTNHTVIVSQGDIAVWSEEFGAQHISGPVTYASSAGSRRIGYAFTDTVWSTVHPNPTNTRNVEEIEARLYAERSLPTLPSADVDAAEEN